MITQVCMYSYRELCIYTKIQRKEMEVLKGEEEEEEMEVHLKLMAVLGLGQHC